MKTYVWTLVVMMGLELFCKLLVLGTGFVPERSKVTIAIDAAIVTGLLIWGTVLLSA